jgi:hypothetical protein
MIGVPLIWDGAAMLQFLQAYSDEATEEHIFSCISPMLGAERPKDLTKNDLFNEPLTNHELLWAMEMLEQAMKRYSADFELKQRKRQK